MRIRHAGGVEGAREARGTVVVIDVLRAFTVSAYALAGGARECRLTTRLEEARALAARIPGSVISAEVDGLPVPGIPISNSPTLVTRTELGGRTLVQRTSAGTQCAAAAAGGGGLVIAASLVVAAATARLVAELGGELVTLVASRPDHPEDPACAAYLESLLEGCPADPERLLETLRKSDRYRNLLAGATPGFPASDLELALRPDRFDFAMPAATDALGLRLTAVPA